MPFKTLSILIPVYNERYFVEQLIGQVLDAPLPEGIERELVVVDDFSTDGTRAILERLAAQNPETISLHVHGANRGKGASIRTAIQHATGDICVVQDADLEYDPKDYRKLLRPILEGDADVVYGSRFLPSDYSRVLFFWHYLGNRFLTTLSNIFTDLNLTDMETCYKAAKSSLLKSIPIRSDRFGMEPELTAKFAKRGCRIYEVPISYRGRSYDEGKKITWRDGLKALFVILYFWLVDDIHHEHYGSANLHSLPRTHRLNKWIAAVVKPWVGETVLEIGAGLGNIALKLLPREHYIVSDPDPHNLEYLANRFGGYGRMDILSLDPESKEQFEALEGAVDTVLCLNVLEQVEKETEVLENIHRALVPGGAAILLVPRWQWLHGPLDHMLGYRRRYSRRALVSACESAGFAVEHTAPFNRAGVLPWLLNSKILRRKRVGKLQLKLYDSFVWLWRILDRVLPLPGLSMIAIARKPKAP